MNTVVTRGRAELLVLRTGMGTEVGAIATMLQEAQEPPTPLQVQLDVLGKRLALIGGVAVAVYAVLALIRGEAVGDLAVRAVALAVAAIPEGLPAVLALTLALGVFQMARRGAIVRKLASVETLGSATVICSDKTGTLTLNQMTVREVRVGDRSYAVSGQGYAPGGEVREVGGERPDPRELAPLCLPAALCNDAALADGGVVGDPTEGALLVLAAKAGIDVAAARRAAPRIAEIPFDAANKYMATFHRDGATGAGGVRLYVKGASDVLLRFCSSVRVGGRAVPLDEARRAVVDRDVEELGDEGLRVLGVASGLLPADAAPPAAADPDALTSSLADLTFEGVVGIADPPRPEAREAIAVCHRAGIQVKMITGDHRTTAAAIAAEIGIRGEVVTGADLDRMSEAELAGRVEAVGVFARVSPEHKVAIVKALTARGHVVAMTGDGVNDAATLRRAHIGVAMGITGTEVTKEAGDMVLADDNFATIVRAVERGRTIFDNVMKFVRFQLSTNLGAIMTFVGASLTGTAAPLSAVQVLWVNIIMDGPPAMALGVDPPRPEVMNEPPRKPTERILSLDRVLRLLRIGVVMALGTLLVYHVGGDRLGREQQLTMTFTTFVLFQLVNSLNARAGTATAVSRQTLTNRVLWISLAAVLVLQVVVVQVPVLHGLFDTTGLSAPQRLVCLGVASSVLVVEEAVKLAGRLRRR